MQYKKGTTTTVIILTTTTTSTAQLTPSSWLLFYKPWHSIAFPIVSIISLLFIYDYSIIPLLLQTITDYYRLLQTYCFVVDQLLLPKYQMLLNVSPILWSFVVTVVVFYYLLNFSSYFSSFICNFYLFLGDDKEFKAMLCAWVSIKTSIVNSYDHKVQKGGVQCNLKSIFQGFLFFFFASSHFSRYGFKVHRISPVSKEHHKLMSQQNTLNENTSQDTSGVTCYYFFSCSNKALIFRTRKQPKSVCSVRKITKCLQKSLKNILENILDKWVNLRTKPEGRYVLSERNVESNWEEFLRTSLILDFSFIKSETSSSCRTLNSLCITRKYM